MSEFTKVIAVGGGPAGISLAIELIEMGLRPEDVLILEKGEVIAKAIQQFYPEKKMTLANYKNLPTQTHGHLECFPDLTKAQTIEYFEKLIQRYKLQYRLNSEVYKIVPEKDHIHVFVNQRELLAEHVAIGIGILGRPNKPAYKLPLKLRDSLLFDLTTQPVKNCRVLVVGGGDTSSEYCQILAEENCELTLCCRAEKITRMMDSNLSAVLELEKKGKIKIYLGQDIQEIQEEDSKPKVVFKDREPEVFDKVIYAIGGTTPVNFLKTIGIEFDSSNWPITGPNGETSIPNVYLIGDLVVGKTGGSIITAYNSSFRTAKKILGIK